MAKKVYVGNLSWNATEDEIRELFEQFGPVQEVALIKDRMTGQSRGFAFVLMADGDAAKAIAALNGSDFGGRALRVNEAREREGGGGGGGRRSGGESRGPGRGYDRGSDRGSDRGPDRRGERRERPRS